MCRFDLFLARLHTSSISLTLHHLQAAKPADGEENEEPSIVVEGCHSVG